MSDHIPFDIQVEIIKRLPIRSLIRVFLVVPLSVDLLWNSFVVGASCGLVCLFGFYRCEDDAEYYPRDATAVLWNPSIRKSVAIPVPNVGGYDEVTFGFGVCGN
ncbi:hypothetical protein Hanom_Chr04g00319181 [Helianthus anomalus]